MQYSCIKPRTQTKSRDNDPFVTLAEQWHRAANEALAAVMFLPHRAVQIGVMNGLLTTHFPDAEGVALWGASVLLHRTSIFTGDAEADRSRVAWLAHRALVAEGEWTPAVDRRWVALADSHFAYDPAVVERAVRGLIRVAADVAELRDIERRRLEILSRREAA